MLFRVRRRVAVLDFRRRAIAGHYPRDEPRRETIEDKNQAAVTAAAAGALAEKLKDYIDAAPNREIRNLGRKELLDLAAAAIAAYANKRAEIEFLEDFQERDIGSPFA